MGLLDERAASPIELESEEQLGALLLAIVQAGKSQGLDAERALRFAVRDLSADIREAERQVADQVQVVEFDIE